MPEAFDYLVRNGTVVDGTGSQPFLADVAVRGDRIAGVFRMEDAPPGLDGLASHVVDASGRLVTPGFVDAHSHSDFNALITPTVDSKLHQGITTEIIGNCGASAFPLRGSALEQEQFEQQQYGFRIDWNDVEAYFERLEGARPAVNLASFVGHGTIRGSVMGFEDRQPTAGELNSMLQEVERAMEAGALGLSTGLIYAPGMFADAAEITALAKVAARHGGMYSSHVRGEGDTLLEAADEFLSVVKDSTCRGQFSHLKASAPKNWGKVARVIESIESANQAGAVIRFDRYPYIASSTSLASLLPRWARNGGREPTLERLRDPGLTRRIIEESAEKNEGRDGWDSVLLSDCRAAGFSEFQGQTVGQIARATGRDPGDVFILILIATELNAGICNFTMSQDDADAVILHPLGMLCTDSGARSTEGPLAQDACHPRAYGSFPKYFRDYVKERPLLTIENAVAKVTSCPCDTFGLSGRGRIREGCYADLLVIDFRQFADEATFASPHRLSTGLDTVFVNGQMTMRDGRKTGERAGRVLRRV